MDKIDVRIYLFTGFLESGKTSFIADTVLNTNFCENERTVLIVTEEGEVAYDEAKMKAAATDLVYVEDFQEFTLEFWQKIKANYHPTQILVEYNGMWDVNQFIDQPFPPFWDVVQVLTTINSALFQLYVNNMRSLLYGHCARSDLIIFNRYDQKTMTKAPFRNNVKAMNPGAQIVYENMDGTINNYIDETLPYDYHAPSLDIPDHDFGIFCYDAMENASRYADKHIRLKGKFIGLDKVIPNGFILGRYAMVCCEQDTSLIGIIVKSPMARKFIPNEWLIVEGDTHLEYDEEMGANIVVLDATRITGCPPLDYEYVTFD